MLVKTCLTWVGLPMTFLYFIPANSSSKILTPLSCAEEESIWMESLRVSTISKLSLDRVMPPLSRLDIWRISPMRDMRCLLDESIFSRQSNTISLLSIFFSAIWVIPIMPLIGVLRSWLILPMKLVLALFAILASSIAFFMSSTAFF